MRTLIVVLWVIALVLLVTACRGEAGPPGDQGPPGPQGPQGEAPSLDEETLAAIASAISESETQASPPPKWEPAEYTKHFVRTAINKYLTEGLDATVAYYNSMESVDGQWYMVVYDQNDIMLVHPTIPAYVGLHSSETVGPNDFPAGDAVIAAADEDGAWFSYNFTNPATGNVEAKHTWAVKLDGLTFGSGWYEQGPAKHDAPAFTRAMVGQAIGLYNAVGREATVDYYNKIESVDGQWYIFIIDEDGYTIGHHNPMFRGRDPALRVDSTGYFYGDDLLSATESGHWVDYVIVNPETGEERQKHTWAVLHDGLIFASGWYE